MMSSKVLFPYLPLFVVCVSALCVSGQNILNKNRPAYQPNFSEYNETLSGAQLALDDDLATYSLAVNNYNHPAFWRVDLENTYVVRRVTVIAPSQWGAYIFNVTVDTVNQNTTIQSSTCYQFSNTTGVGPSKEMTNLCEGELVGNYVTVRRSGGPQLHLLAIAEVKVEGTVLGDVSTTPGKSTTFGSRLGSGAIAGILIGCIAFAALVVALGILTVHFYSERSESTQSKTAAKYDGKPGFDSPTLHPITSAKKAEETNRREIQVDNTRPVYEKLRNSNKEDEPAQGQYTPLQIVSVVAEFEASNCKVDYYNCK